MADKKEPKIDMKALGEVTKKVLAYQPAKKRKAKSTSNPGSAARK